MMVVIRLKNTSKNIFPSNISAVGIRFRLGKKLDLNMVYVFKKTVKSEKAKELECI